jgi:hypothetical protein
LPTETLGASCARTSGKWFFPVPCITQLKPQARAISPLRAENPERPDSVAPNASVRASAAPWLRFLGPGLVTGAADDDPSGIATYCQIGARFGFAMLWTLVLAYPLMAAIQEASAWVGRVTGAGPGSGRWRTPLRFACQPDCGRPKEVAGRSESELVTTISR